MTKRIYLKFALVTIQLITVGFIFEMALFGSAWSTLLGAILTLPLFGVRCRNCGTDISDKRIMGTWLPVSPKIVDRCPVCGEPMA